MTVKDLIENKDYDYISWRVTLPKDLVAGDTFMGASKSVNGELITLDGDTYCEETEVLNYEEWSNPEKGIASGLTIVVEGHWISNRN